MYDGANPYLQVSDSTALSGSGTPAISQRYLYGAAVDQILATDNCNGTVLWGLAENNGTIRDVVQYNSGTGQTNLLDHRVYNSFGLITSETNSAVNFAFGFDGMRWDAAAKLYFTATVPYDPAAEERISRDPDGFASGTTNFYAWCGNDPIGESDPSGECDQATSPQPNSYIENGPTEHFSLGTNLNSPNAPADDGALLACVLGDGTRSNVSGVQSLAATTPGFQSGPVANENVGNSSVGIWALSHSAALAPQRCEAQPMDTEQEAYLLANVVGPQEQQTWEYKTASFLASVECGTEDAILDMSGMRNFAQASLSVDEGNYGDAAANVGIAALKVDLLAGGPVARGIGGLTRGATELLGTAGDYIAMRSAASAVEDTAVGEDIAANLFTGTIDVAASDLPTRTILLNGEEFTYTPGVLSTYPEVTAAGDVPSEANVFANHAWGKPETVPCFPAETLVHTPDGLREIKTLREGDLVLSYDSKSGRIMPAQLPRAWATGR